MSDDAKTQLGTHVSAHIDASDTVSVELNEVLNEIANIGNDMMSKISTEFSEDDPINDLINNVVSMSDRSDNGSIEDERQSVIEALSQYARERVQKVSDSSSSEDEHDVENCKCHLPRHLQHAADTLLNKESVIPLIKDMSKHGVLDDFLLIIEMLKEGKLSPDNLPMQLTADLAKMMKCDSTTGMRFKKKTMDFWSVFYRTCHTSGITLMSGGKNSGLVSAGINDKGQYNPSDGNFNFAVPDVKTILRHQKKLDKYMYSGIMKGSFNLVNPKKQYVLEYDAKRIATGFGPNNVGQVNLWGYEGPPNLDEKKRQLEEELSLIDELEENNMDKKQLLFKILTKMMSNITKRIHKKRLSIMGHTKYLKETLKMCEGNPRLKKKYNKSIQDTKANIYVLKKWIEDALNLNLRICALLSEINGTLDLFTFDRNVDLQKQGNCKFLHNPEQIKHRINFNNHPEAIKQKSKEWFDLRNKCRVTGSTLFNALCLSSLKLQKEHFEQFIEHKKPKDFPEDVQVKIDHGNKNEVSQ